MSDHYYVSPELIPLARALEGRYPGVSVVYGRMTQWDDGTVQQHIRYCAPLEMLRHYGLVTTEMEQLRNPGRTALGDGFHLCQGLDDLSLPGCYDLSILTGSRPRERDRISTKDAQRLLRQVFKRAKGGASHA